MSDAGGGAPDLQLKQDNNDSGHINIKVKDQNENEVFFKIKKTTKLSKVFNAYCTRKSIQRESVRFLLDGSRVQGEDTPKSLDMEDGDMIESVLEQAGGDATPQPVAQVHTKGDDTPSHSSAIDIKIIDDKGHEFPFKIKRTCKFSKIFEAYTDIQSLNSCHVCFTFNDIKICGEETPQYHGTEYGDVIYASTWEIYGSTRDFESLLTIGINDLRVLDTNAPEDLKLLFKAKRSIQLGKVFDIWKRSQSLGHQEAHFLYNGGRVQEEATPDILAMQDEDMINAVIVSSLQFPSPDSAAVQTRKPNDITFKVTDNVGDIFYRISRNKPLVKLITPHNERWSFEHKTTFFMFNGHRICDSDTAESPGIVQGDTIVVVLVNGIVSSSLDGEAAKPKAGTETLIIEMRDPAPKSFFFQD
jgi:small ubiquitin-related modifier